METLCRYNFPVKIVVLNNGGIGPGMPEIPENPMMNMKPNSLIWGARYDRMMEAFGGKGFYVEDPRDLKGALEEAMNFKGPALVNCLLSQGSARKPQRFRWHSQAALTAYMSRAAPGWRGPFFLYLLGHPNNVGVT